MTDMLVKLYDLPILSREAALAERGIAIKQAMALDRRVVCDFVAAHFADVSKQWVDECEAALLQQPSTCFIAVHEKRVIGFCCYDATAKGMLGPLGVHRDFRGHGVAQELMRRSFEAMRFAGYAYAVIGWVSSEAYYAKTCDAVPIADSFPGVYARRVAQ
jgi:predicted N-acetyltransferase YhbS